METPTQPASRQGCWCILHCDGGRRTADGAHRDKHPDGVKLRRLVAVAEDELVGRPAAERAEDTAPRRVQCSELIYDALHGCTLRIVPKVGVDIG